jgi:hypothetical protein
MGPNLVLQDKVELAEKIKPDLYEIGSVKKSV